MINAQVNKEQFELYNEVGKAGSLEVRPRSVRLRVMRELEGKGLVTKSPISGAYYAVMGYGATYAPVTCLEEMYQSEEWCNWDSDNRSCGSCGIIVADPERFDRICEAAEDGSDGSTHSEIINDWLDFLRNCADYDEETTDRIEEEIFKVERWHSENGSLCQSLG